jgi:hypothetical protein
MGVYKNGIDFAVGEYSPNPWAMKRYLQAPFVR